MPKRISISIPIPCHEKWQDMTPAEKGRFCGACQKTVRDFTKSSDRDIAESLKEPKICGRFLSSQLERELILQQRRSSLWLAASVAVMGFLALGTNEAVAQTPVATVQNPSTHLKDIDITLQDDIIISGIVKDSASVLPGAVVKNLKTRVSTQTDMDGKFKIAAAFGDILEVNYIGYKKSIVNVTENTPVKIVLQEDLEYLTLGVVVTVRPPLHKRIYYHIRNWFR